MDKRPLVGFTVDEGCTLELAKMLPEVPPRLTLRDLVMDNAIELGIDPAVVNEYFEKYAPVVDPVMERMEAEADRVRREILFGGTCDPLEVLGNPLITGIRNG